MSLVNLYPLFNPPPALIASAAPGSVGVATTTGGSGAPGAAGAAGVAATISVGSTLTSAPGSSASVVNTGSASAAVLQFTIPQGAPGAGVSSGSAISCVSLTAATGSFSTLLAGTGSFVQLAATAASVSSLAAATGSISTLFAGTGSFVSLSAPAATLSSLAAATGSVSTLLAGTGSFVQLSAASLAATSLTASSAYAATGSISTLLAGTGSFVQLAATAASVSSLAAATGSISTLLGGTGSFVQLSSTAATVASLAAATGSISTLFAGTGSFVQLSATAGSVSSLSAATGSISTLYGGTGSFVQLYAATGSISTLLAGTGSFVQLAATAASVSSLAAATGSISTLLAGTGSFVQLSATAASVSSLTAATGSISTLLGGTVSAARLTATQLSAGTGTFNTVIAATGSFVNFSAATGSVANNLNVGGVLAASAMTTYTVAAPGGLQGLYLSYPTQNDAGLYAYTNIRLHSGSTQGQQTNVLVAGPSSVQVNQALLGPKNTLDDGAGNMTVQGALSGASASFVSLAATAASVSSFAAATGSISTLLAGTGSFVQLSATAASVSSLAAATGSISTLLAGTGSFVQLSAAAASVSSLAAATGYYSAGLSTARLAATAASVSSLVAATGSLGQLLLTGSASPATLTLDSNGNSTFSSGLTVPGNLTGTTASFSGTGTFATLLSTTSRSQFSTVSSAFVSQGSAQFTTLAASGVVQITQLGAGTGSFGSLTAGTGSFVSLAAGTGSFGLLLAGTGSFASQVVGSTGSVMNQSTVLSQNSAWLLRSVGSSANAPSAANTFSVVASDTGLPVLTATQLGRLTTGNIAGLGSTLDDGQGGMLLTGGSFQVQSSGTSLLSVNQSAGLRSLRNVLDDAKGNLVVAATGSFSQLQTSSLTVSGSGSVSGNLFANAMTTYSIGSPGQAGLGFAYPGQNDAALYAVSYIRLHGDSSQGQATNQLVVGGGQVKCNAPLLSQYNTLDNGAGSVVVAAALNINQGGTAITGTQLACAQSSGAFFTNAVAGDSVIRNQTNANIRLGFFGASGAQAASLTLGYPYAVATRNNTLDDGASGNMTALGRMTAASVQLSNTTLLPGGTASTSLTLPVVSGTVALAPQFICFAHSSTGFAISSNQLAYSSAAFVGSNGCSYSGPTITLPSTACLYQVSLCITATVSASSTGAVLLTGSGNSIQLGPLASYTVNTSSSAQSLTISYSGIVNNTAGMAASFYFATQNLTGVVGGSLSFRQIS